MFDVIPNITESMLETMEVTGNIWEAVATGEISEQQAREILDGIFAGEERMKE